MSPQLKAAIEDASVEDLLFSETPFVGHSIKAERKIGYSLVSVKGVSTGADLKIAYVKGNDGEEYWYICSQLTPEQPLEYPIFGTEAEAKHHILKALKKCN